MIEAVSTLMSDDGFPLLVIFDPVGLFELQEHDPNASLSDIDHSVLTFEILPIGKLKKQFEDWTQGHFRRAAMINVTNMLDELTHRLAEISRSEESDVRLAILNSLRGREDGDDGNP